jgi:site-specific DNA-adenine methylase
VLSDLNADLICAYAALRDQVEPVIAELSRYPHDRVRPRDALQATALAGAHRRLS